MKLSDLEDAKKLGEELARWKGVLVLLNEGYDPRLAINRMELVIDRSQASIIAEKYIAAARIRLSEMGVEE